jgi:hypothetical protein
MASKRTTHKSTVSTFRSCKLSRFDEDVHDIDGKQIDLTSGAMIRIVTQPIGYRAYRPLSRGGIIT